MSFIEALYGKDVFLICGIDSIGLPYTPDNEDGISFVDILARRLEEQGINVTYINMCSLVFNKTWDMKDIFEKGYTKKSYTEKNKKRTKALLRKKGFKYTLRDDFVETYFKSEEDDINITDIFKNSDNPVFLYTCGGLNLKHYLKFDSNNKKKIIYETLFHLLKHFKQTLKDVDESINYLIGLNENITIFALGYYTIIKNDFLRFILRPLYKKYNDELEKICAKYPNVVFVDLFDTEKFMAPEDFHPTKEGQEHIASRIEKAMENVNTK